MKVLFYAIRETPSALFNWEKLQKLSALGVEVEREGLDGPDVILAMGQDDLRSLRETHPDVPLGVIDARSPLELPLADFAICNGVESMDWSMLMTPQVFQYAICPEFERKERPSPSDDRVHLGYHGNLLHLQEMHPRITGALESLDREVCITVVGPAKAGELKWSLPKVEIHTVPWSSTAYDELRHCHAGLVPNTIPVEVEDKIDHRHFYPYDYGLFFKSTSNNGRILAFAQLGVPVVCDMFPSALQTVQDGHDGFIAHSSEAWMEKLRRLVEDPVLGQTMAQNLMKRYDERYSHEVENRRLLEFLKGVKRLSGERTLPELRERVPQPWWRKTARRWLGRG